MSAKIIEQKYGVRIERDGKTYTAYIAYCPIRSGDLDFVEKYLPESVERRYIELVEREEFLNTGTVMEKVVIPDCSTKELVSLCEEFERFTYIDKAYETTLSHWKKYENFPRANEYAEFIKNSYCRKFGIDDKEFISLCTNPNDRGLNFLFKDIPMNRWDSMFATKGFSKADAVCGVKNAIVRKYVPLVFLSSEYRKKKEFKIQGKTFYFPDMVEDGVCEWYAKKYLI